ncbi:uncharacterized protein VTP21DRAFT_5879 [Calcarisporiella thermophila]|uniref:uncharacterized protein n=1 Tax=Calcarisporiella thermophila TaxID=911321 RepID=UPI0037447940
MSLPSSPIFRLSCPVQNYDWGKLGTESKVAQLASSDPEFKIDEAKPYAELWMGTHPNGPAHLYGNGSVTLKDILASTPELMTESILKSYNGDLPFLFKILSVRKALSIQAHPDKNLGAQLFQQFPQVYKDPNHKPEQAIALTPFEALCGFRPLEEIVAHLDEFEEFRELVGESVVEEFRVAVKKNAGSTSDEAVRENKKVLKHLFTALMTSEAPRVKTQLEKLVARLDPNAPAGSMHELLARLHGQFPGDVGVFCALLMNYICLQPGQSIYLGANEPHAYLSGDCVECMAASDNVVRAGLTPKFKDVQVLVGMLTYHYGSAESQIMPGRHFPGTKHTILYDPPIEEFSILVTPLQEDQGVEHFEAIHGPSILVCTEGAALLEGAGQSIAIETGQVYFVGAGVPISVTARSGGAILFRAFATANE